MAKSNTFNTDCMEFMRNIPDKYYDLAVVDPPYGLDNFKNNHSRSKIWTSTDYEKKDWDASVPDKSYFDELLRVSKNQVIFGANHFISKIPYDSSCWIVWDKMNGSNDFADCELAWTSFKKAVRIFRFRWSGFLQGYTGGFHEKRIHPCQKPIALYRFIFDKFSQAGWSVIDTHLGSGSSRIAAYLCGLDFTGIEKDEDYFKDEESRFENFVKSENGKLF